MRTNVLRKLLSATVATALLAVAPAAMAEEKAHGSFVVGADTGRIFGDQGFPLTRKPVAILDATLCKARTCVELWSAQSLVGRPQDHEIDANVWHDFLLGLLTVQVKGGYYEVKGKDIWDATITGSVPINKSCVIAVSYEKDEGGFDENVWKLKAPCTIALKDGWTLNVAPAVAHSTAFPGTTSALDLAFNHALTENVTLSFTGKGYYRSESRKAGIVGVKLIRTF